MSTPSKKKVTPSKKAQSKFVKGRDSSKKPESQSTGQSFVATYEYRPAEVIAELNAENELLRDKIRQLTDPRPSPQQSNQPQKERQSCLNDIAGGYNHQLSRLTLNVTALIEIGNRIQQDKTDGCNENQPDPHDLTTRFTNYNNYFSYQNDRLEAVLTKLQNLV
jgi:hypothetical protein